MEEQEEDEEEENEGEDEEEGDDRVDDEGTKRIEQCVAFAQFVRPQNWKNQNWIR